MSGTRKVKEGSYTTPDGKSVSYTDAQTFQLATDLYQFIDHDYKGSPSVDAVRLESIIKSLQAGSPLDADEWNILNDLKKRAGAAFDRWRASGRDGQGAEVPEGSGRLGEAATVLPPSLRFLIRETGGYKTASTTTKDRHTTPPHLLDGALHDLAHAKQHADRLTDPDVRSNPGSLDFNVEHLMKHLVSGTDHISRMGKHLEEYATSPKVFAKERASLHKLRESAARVLRDGNLLREAVKLSVSDREVVAADPQHPDTNLPTIAVDFDGVIHMGAHGMPGEIEGDVMPGAAEGLKVLAQRYKVVVLTARQDFAAVRAWLNKNHIDQYVHRITNVKPQALAYIDDRAVHFNGDWKMALKAVDPSKATYQPIQVKKVFA